MAETFNNACTKLASNTLTTVYQAPTASATDCTVVLSCLISNSEAGVNIPIYAYLTNSSDTVLSRLAEGVIVPSYASLELIANKLILKQGHKLRIRTSSAASAEQIQVTVSALDVTA